MTTPGGVSGGRSASRPEDRELLIDWVRAFLVETLQGEGEHETEIIVDSALDTGSRTFLPLGGRGAAGLDRRRHGPDTERDPCRAGVHAARGPETRLRQRGHRSREPAQLDAGRRFVFLFTDLDNSTSNKIYQAIGYEPVIDIDQWAFEPVGAR